jgi:hypothetical protein
MPKVGSQAQGAQKAMSIRRSAIAAASAFLLAPGREPGHVVRITRIQAASVRLLP